MTAMYVKTTNGRHFVNEDFVDLVGDLYPGTWEKIPLGWHVYTGWQGKDEVLFTEHAPIEDKDLEGQVYEVNWPPVRPEAFFGDILPFIEHRKLAHQKDSPMTRQRITWDKDELRAKWGMTLDETIEMRKKQADLVLKDPAKFLKGLDDAIKTNEEILAKGDLDAKWAKALRAQITGHKKMRQDLKRKTAARIPSGMYGYTKSVQGMCEVANRRINKHAALAIKKAAQRDPRILDFLGAHAKRAKSLPARILLASYKNAMPKAAAIEKEAGPRHYGAYGYPAKTANMGFNLCSQMREHAGVVAADLHRRKAAMYVKITGFLGAHGKQGKSGASKLLLSVYPDEAMSFGKRASVETHPQSVDDWLAWEPDAT